MRVVRGPDASDTTLRRSDIEKMAPAGSSLMPEGVLDGLSDTDIRNFFAYLRSPNRL
jgi:hypothetical protein